MCDSEVVKRLLWLVSSQENHSADILKSLIKRSLNKLLLTYLKKLITFIPKQQYLKENIKKKMTAPTKEQVAAAKLQAFMKICGPGGKYQLGPGKWEGGNPGEAREITGTCFVKGPQTLREAFDLKVGEYASREFIIFGNNRFTFKQFWERVSSLGSALIEKYGLKKGDRVGISMQNCNEWMESFCAATAIGCVAVPLNSWWKGAELEYGISDAGCKLMICDKKRFESCMSFLPKLGVSAITVGCSLTGADTYDVVISQFKGKQCPPSSATADDIATIMYTSGTTGHPKGVASTHRGIMTMFCLTVVTKEVKCLLGAATADEIETVILPVPLFHVTACHHIFLASIANGRKLVVMSKWDAGLALKLIEREKATSWTGVPTMVQDLMEHPDFSKTDTSTLKSVGGGGAPTPHSQVKKMQNRFKQSQPTQGYGLTETNGAIAWIAGDEYLARPGSTGTPLPTVETLVIDIETGKVLPEPGQRGELLIKSPLNYGRYWNKAKSTNESIVEIEGHGYGWFKTGDVVEMDSERYIYIKDRAKDIIIRGGENISCAEVESAFFASSKGIYEVSCFGVKHQRLGEVVGLLVFPKPGYTLKPVDMVSVMKQSGVLADFKIPSPKHIFFTPQPLPRGATGKILKRVIRDEYNKRLSAEAKL